jgi:hypothetical protein
MFEMMTLSDNQRYGLRIEKTQLADSTTYELLEACFSHDRSMHQLVSSRSSNSFMVDPIQVYCGRITSLLGSSRMQRYGSIIIMRYGLVGNKT